MTGAEYIAKFLCEKQVDTVFGYPGAAVLELYNMLFEKSGINAVTVRHEQGAVFAAVGYAKASGKTGVCIATSGPGAANLITGIADAYLDSTPLIVITGQVDRASIGRDAFQEADIMGMTIPITKHNYLIKDPANLAPSLEEAWNIASSGRCGPVVVDITKDVFAAEITDTDKDAISHLPRKRTSVYTVGNGMGAIKEAVENSHRPLILAGGGIVSSGASGALSEFALKSGIPVVTTLMGMGIVLDQGVELFGMAGMHGSEAANVALYQCDLLIAIGVRFSDRTVSNQKLFSQSRMIIHCDIDPAELGKNVTPSVKVVSDAKDFLYELISSDLNYDKEAFSEWSDSVLKYKNKKVYPKKEGRLSAGEILREIDRCVLDMKNCVYVSDVGNFQMDAAIEAEPVCERGFITSGGLGAMGFGLPAAIGASFAVSDNIENIILFCGDGGFQMSLEELATLCRAKRPIKIFIFDNGELGMIRDIQKKGGLSGETSVLCGNPDFELIGKAYGVKTARLSAEDRDNLSVRIKEIMDCKENMIIRCMV